MDQKKEEPERKERERKGGKRQERKRRGREWGREGLGHPVQGLVCEPAQPLWMRIHTQAYTCAHTHLHRCIHAQASKQRAVQMAGEAGLWPGLRHPGVSWVDLA